MSRLYKKKSFLLPSVIISLVVFSILGEIDVRLFVKNSEITLMCFGDYLYNTNLHSLPDILGKPKSPFCFS